MNKRRVAVAVSIVLAVTALLYLGGVLGQFFINYEVWLEMDGIAGQAQMEPVEWSFITCIPAAFSLNGLKGMGLVTAVVGGLVVYYRLQNRFGGKDLDPRGFKTSSTGAYGTAGWMSEKEMQSVLEINSIDKAKGTILGEHRGRAVCMPEDTRLNRHIGVFGASGTMKSRAVIRNALFQSIKRGESVVITDPKGELYNDTSELYRKYGYEVKVFNLVDPAHGDSWNCMADLGGDTLMAQVLTNVIIGNTSSGETDHFWDSATRSHTNTIPQGAKLCGR